MTLQNLDFGTSATNDGESLFAAFTKIEANTVALYASDGTVTHAVTDVASAATCDIGAATTDRVRITGTVTITSLGTSASKLRFVHFSGALTLTHNATSLICIGGSNILTVAGDTCIFSSDADGNWRMLSFNRGASLATGDFSGPASSTDNAIVRFDSTTGKVGQNSIVSIDDSGNIAPATTDTGALGTTALAWADLFIASGGTLHFADTDWVATHTTGILTVGTGDLRVTTAGTNTASVVTVGGTQTLTAKTLTSPTIGTSPTAAGATWTDLGTVTTADINGGTLDGVTIGGSSAAAATVTTLTVNTNANPDTDDGAALGTTLLGWADLFLASGGTVHFANTDWVATHSTGILTVGTGDLRVTTAGTNAASVVTVGGTQTLTAKTLTSPVIGTSPTAAGATWTDLGTVTTADINGGTIDGTVIGGASAAAGTFTTIGGTAITGTGLLTVSLAGNAARFLNTTDGASVQVARFEGDRATMADADEAYLSLMLSNDAGTQTEFARLTWVATDVNAGTSVDGRLDFAVTTAGTLANELQLDGTALSPSADGGSSLGTTALGWQNLFGNTGFVLNVEGGDWVATHTAGILTVGTGDLRVTTAGTNTASAVTVGGTQTLTGKSVSLTTNTLTGSVTEFNTALGSADFGTFAAAATDNAAVRSDGTGGLLQTSALIISDTGDLTAYDATNDGNPVFAFGASATERLTVTPTYDTGAQTLDYVEFATAAASATADKGLFRFNVDGTAILDIDDGGINFAASKGISIAGTDILTDAAGTATLSNIDALDATTEATIEAAIDTLANLTSIQGRTVTLADAALDVIFGWDDSGSAYKNFALADLTDEGSPAAGDYVVIYGAEGDLRKANWSTLPGAGAGISNVVEDATPELGGDLESNNNDIKMEQFSADAVAADIYFQKSRHASIGSHTIVQDGDDLGKLIFQGSNGTSFDSAAQIRGEVDGTPGASTDMPGRLVFSTTADASATLTDRLILDAAGVLKPSTNDGVALGTTALGFADLHLATGGVVNWANGEVTITETDANTLTVAGATAVSLGTSAAFTTGTIELGAASDTTLARSAAGVVTIEGSVVKTAGKETVCVPAGAMTAGTVAGPAAATVQVASGLNYIKTLDFDGAGTAPEYAYFQIAMPTSWNEGTITYQVFWTSTATDTDGVVWGLQAVSVADNETLNATFGTTVELIDNAQSNSTELLASAESGNVTVGGTPTAGELVLFRFYRDPNNASDGHTEDARLVQLKLFITTDAKNDA